MFVTWVLVWKVHIREAGFQWIQYWSLVHRRGESDQLRSMMNWTSEGGQMAMRQSLKEWLQWGSTAPEFYEKLLEYSMNIICNYSSAVPKTLQQEAVQYICRLDVFRPLMSGPCLLALHGNTQVSTKWLVTTSWSNAPLHSLHQLRTHSKLNSARILVHGCCPQQPLHGREPPLCTCQEEQGFQKDQNGYSYIPADNYKHLGLNFQDLTSVKNLVNPFSLFCSLTC